MSILDPSNKINMEYLNCLSSGNKKHLVETLEKGLFEQTSNRLLHAKISELYESMPSENDPTKIIKARSNNHKEVSKMLNKIITDKNPHFTQPRITKAIAENFGIDINGADENYQWLAQYAYEFIFIQLPSQEIQKNRNADFFSYKILNKDDICSSFVNLKKAFFLLNPALVLGICARDFDFKINFRSGTKNISVESKDKYDRILRSEGIYESPFELIPENLNFDDEDMFHNFDDTASSIFFDLFGDLAHQTIEENNYDLFSHSDNLSISKNDMLKFVLADFIPKVINKIMSYISSLETSGLGFAIYSEYSKVWQLKSVNSEQLINLKSKTTDLLNKNLTGFESFINYQLDSSKASKEYAKIVKDKSLFNPTDSTMTVEKLFETFEDLRKRKGKQ